MKVIDTYLSFSPFNVFLIPGDRCPAERYRIFHSVLFSTLKLYLICKWKRKFCTLFTLSGFKLLPPRAVFCPSPKGPVDGMVTTLRKILGDSWGFGELDFLQTKVF